jgi:UDPglucose 6-dehydrogenase
MAQKQTVGMVGLGYVGLSTAACFLSRGIRVVGVDVDKTRVASLSKGLVPIHEDGVEPILRDAIASGLVSFHPDYQALDGCNIVFLAVGTPGLPGGAIDTTYIEAAASAVGERIGSMAEYPVVVVKSTVTPSTTRTKVLPILERQSGIKCGQGFGLCTNPEFLREGKALWDMMHPDAIVLGKIDQRSVKVMKSLYRLVYRRMPPVLVTESINAEFIKYGVNSFRAVQLSFINTLANMCSRMGGAEIDEVMKGLLLVARVDSRYSRAGLGFGGSCLPKDSNALLSLARSLKVDESMLSTAMAVNSRQVGEAIFLAENLIGPIRNKSIALLGLTFKAGTDDVRESVGIRLANALVEMGAEVKAFDPGYKPNTNETFELAASARDCLRKADCCVVTNEWEEFRELTPHTFKRLMNRPAVVDGRGLYDIRRFAKAGVRVRRIGVGESPS